MRVLVVKDGTVPVVVARVLGADMESSDWLEVATQDSNLELELFEVDGDPEALDVTWADGEGFSVYGTTIEAWMKDRQADECGGPIDVVNGRQGHLHLVQSDVCHGSEDEHWYSHLFVIGGA